MKLVQGLEAVCLLNSFRGAAGINVTVNRCVQHAAHAAQIGNTAAPLSQHTVFCSLGTTVFAFGSAPERRMCPQWTL